MSKPDKHTENIFRQRLMNAEVNPPPKAWEQIANNLDLAAKNRRLIFYRRIVASAAVIIILLSIGVGFLYKKQQVITPKKLTILPSDPTLQAKDSNVVINTPVILENLAEKEQKTKESPKINQSPVITEIYTNQNLKELQKNEASVVLAPIQQIAANNLAIDFNWPALLVHQKQSGSNSFLSLVDLNKILINEGLIADAPAPTPREKHWSIGGEISPGYTSVSQPSIMIYDAANGLSGELTRSNNKSETVTAYSGGLAVNYNLSDKWSLQSGLYYFRQNQEINSYAVLSNRAAYNNILSTLTNSGTIEFTSENAITYNEPVYQIDVDLNNNIAQYDETLIQQFGFIEIPFILKYKILSKKLDIFLLGGFDANILINNSVYIGKSSNQSVGQTNELNSLIYKSTLGVSLEYPINKRLYFNLSPIVKYQLTPIGKETLNNYKTRFIEYRTGFSYHF